MAPYSIIGTVIIISSLTVWQPCLGLVCFSCTTIIDNGVAQPGNQTCTLFHAAGEDDRRTRFVEMCPPGVKACSQTEKRGFRGQSSGASYDIIQKGCYGRTFVNKARLNMCEDSSGGSGGNERVCLCDTDYCLMEVKVEEKVKSSGTSIRLFFRGMVLILISLIL